MASRATERQFLSALPNTHSTQPPFHSTETIKEIHNGVDISPTSTNNLSF